MTVSQISPLVVKIGGKFFDLMAENPNSMEHFFEFLKSMFDTKKPVVLVHGGGSQVTDLLSKLGKSSNKLDGLRVTPDGDIDIVAGVLSGQLNKRLVSKCTANKIPAVGISLADGNLAHCFKLSEALGWVGEPSNGDALLLSALFKNGFMPIVATIGCDDNGNLFNINADHAAMHLSKLINADLMLLSDVPGVLDNDKNLIKELNTAQINNLIENAVITDGMIVKVKSAKEAADKIQRTVIIASWNDAIAETQSKSIDFGTKILPELSSQLA